MIKRIDVLMCWGIILLQSDLAWVNWSTIQDRVREAQPEHHMCVHKQEINELDIYHRILRYELLCFDRFVSHNKTSDALSSESPWRSMSGSYNNSGTFSLMGNIYFRFNNYMVAMVNKNLLPLQVHVPCIGDFHYLSRGLKWNLEFLLFCKYLMLLFQNSPLDYYYY